jgi:hypothetical protein
MSQKASTGQIAIPAVGGHRSAEQYQINHLSPKQTRSASIVVAFVVFAKD